MFGLGQNYGFGDTADTGFGDAFDCGDQGGAFLGWDGDATMYGAAPAPADDWTFWRLDTWANFTNNNQTYDTDWSHLVRDLNNHGRNFPGPDDVMLPCVLWFSGTGFY